ncbi:TPA: DUF968 domain-containing protein, partial [Escherichia coli]
ADDPHHLIGHGQGGMGTKAHDLFVLPLCRKHHDELHADTVAFEEMYGSQLELIFRLDHLSGCHDGGWKTRFSRYETVEGKMRPG